MSAPAVSESVKVLAAAALRRASAAALDLERELDRAAELVEQADGINLARLAQRCADMATLVGLAAGAAEPATESRGVTA